MYENMLNQHLLIGIECICIAWEEHVKCHHVGMMIENINIFKDSNKCCQEHLMN